MKKAITLLTAVISVGYLTAQNGQSFKNDYEGYSQDNRRVEFFDGKNYRKVEVSEGLQVKKTGENSYVTYKEIKNQPSRDKNNYQLKIIIEGDFKTLVIANGDGFLDLVGWYDIEDNIFETTLPEGYYDIVLNGTIPDEEFYIPAFLCFEQILIDKDIELVANFDDAVHKISFAPVDVNNVLIDNWAGSDTDIKFTLMMHPSIGFGFSNWVTGYSISLLNVYVNDIGSRNRIVAIVGAYNETTGDEYAISFPIITNGVSEDIVFKNTSDEIYHFKQLINAPENFDDVLYSYTGSLQLNYDFEIGHSYSYLGGIAERSRDKNTPYSLYSNYKYNDSPKTGDINNFVLPISCDYVNWEMPLPWAYKGLVVGNPMAMNNKAELIMNFFPKFNGVLFALRDINEILGSLGNNPITKVWNEEEFYYEGFRTPILYHQTRNVSAAKNPEEITILGDFWFLFLGEYGEQKFNHGDMNVKITGDETEIYNDELYKLYLPMFNGINIDDTYSKYQIEVVNDDVFAYGKKMLNNTVIDFDMTKTDVNPPTLTMLRIIDNEKISMFISDINTARLEITAGDFMLAYEELPDDPDVYLENLAYDKKPDIKIYWSSNGETFNVLPAQEDESKFHLGYGNFFNVSLAPLATAGIEEGWITIKIVLTDEVGNSQVQVLEPLFYYGDFVGIEKTTLSNNLKSLAYPNPFNDKITIELDNPVSGLTYFEIYDISGRIVHQQKVNATEIKSFSYNGKHLKEGIYFYGIYNQGNVISGKIVKK